MDAEKKIRFLQKQIDQFKHMHSTGSVGTNEARRQIRLMEKTITDLLEELPQHKRDMYSIKREHGL